MMSTDLSQEQVVTVTDVQVRFDDEGNVLPLVQISPAMMLPDGGCTNLLVGDIARFARTGIAVGDRLVATYDAARTAVRTHIVQLAAAPRMPLDVTRCPICGEPLIQSATGMGRCINLNCKAQLRTNIRALTMALGLNVFTPMNPVLDMLLTRGALSSLLDLFRLPEVQLADGGFFTPNDVRLLHAYLHSVRGKTSLHQLLNGLRVPGWTTDDTLRLDLYFRQQHWGLLQISNLFSPMLWEQFPVMDWSAWRLFVDRPVNQMVIIRLAEILYL